MLVWARRSLEAFGMAQGIKWVVGRWQVAIRVFLAYIWIKVRLFLHERPSLVPAGAWMMWLLRGLGAQYTRRGEIELSN